MASSIKTALEESIRLFNSNQFVQACDKSYEVLQESSATQDQKAKAYFVCSLCEEKKKNLSQALELAKKSYAINPNDSEVHYFLGSMYAALGDSENAKSFFEKTLEKNARNTFAWLGLVDCQHYQALPEKEVKIIKTLLSKDEKLDVQEKSNLYFTLGKIYDDLESYQEAMDAYSQANFLRDEHFNSGHFELTVQLIKEQFNRDFVHQFEREAPYTDFTPIFVVGVPRSGTTLVEQILSSHSKVHGAGEIIDIVSMIAQLPRQLKVKDVPTAYKNLNIDVLNQLALAYKERRFIDIPRKKTFIVNKSPINFMYLGFIKMVLPNAKVIYMRRHPGDTCVSCYSRPFGHTNEYSFDLIHLGYYYRKSLEMMQYWHKTLDSDFILNLPYELLVNKPEETVRRLIDFCGLEWEQACLEHHKLDRYVSTPSQLQVKKPIYQSSVGRWEHYREWMQPLLRLDNEIAEYEAELAKLLKD